jgi:glycosyltransferase involved in cell wall biosynthesis
MISFFPTSGDKHGWAIDEDLRLIRAALAGIAKETSLASAQVVHSPFWAALGQHSPGVLARRFVIAHADNPPFFYLTQPSFAKAQQVVDLWVARSTEAKAQFDLLDLPSVHIPYAIDEDLFFQIPDRVQLRKEFGLPEDAYILGNFHRDSEGADLSTPKFQKSPEMLVQICGHLLQAGAKIHVLLAGPRRHWIRNALREAGVAFTFVGKEIPEDDFGINILPRTELNRLYNACDIYLIPSRWEGGPQSAMEAAACRTKMLSIPLGVGKDILEPESLFDCASEAASKILEDIRTGSLTRTCEPQYERWKARHTSSSMTAALRELYAGLGDDASFQKKSAPRPMDGLRDLVFQLRHRFKAASPRKDVALIHDGGSRIETVRQELLKMGIRLQESSPFRIAGWVCKPADYANAVPYQFAEPDFKTSDAIPGACVIFASVQEVVNYRSSGGKNPVLVCPIPPTVAQTNHAPFVVERENLTATESIARAMADGQPVVYPEHLTYYYQVFHGGLPYGLSRTRQEAIETARLHAADFQALARPAKTMGPFLRNLLA